MLEGTTQYQCIENFGNIVISSLWKLLQLLLTLQKLISSKCVIIKNNFLPSDTVLLTTINKAWDLCTYLSPIYITLGILLTFSHKFDCVPKNVHYFCFKLISNNHFSKIKIALLDIFQKIFEFGIGYCQNVFFFGKSKILK